MENRPESIRLCGVGKRWTVVVVWAANSARCTHYTAWRNTMSNRSCLATCHCAPAFNSATLFIAVHQFSGERLRGICSTDCWRCSWLAVLSAGRRRRAAIYCCRSCWIVSLDKHSLFDCQSSNTPAIIAERIWTHWKGNQKGTTKNK